MWRFSLPIIIQNIFCSRWFVSYSAKGMFYISCNSFVIIYAKLFSSISYFRQQRKLFVPLGLNTPYLKNMLIVGPSIYLSIHHASIFCKHNKHRTYSRDKEFPWLFIHVATQKTRHIHQYIYIFSNSDSKFAQQIHLFFPTKPNFVILLSTVVSLITW